jgi:hypothetical protein
MPLFLKSRRAPSTHSTPPRFFRCTSPQNKGAEFPRPIASYTSFTSFTSCSLISQSAPVHSAAPPLAQAATSVVPSNYPVSPPAARSSPCTLAHNPYASRIPAAASPPCISPAALLDIPSVASTSAPVHPRKHTGTATLPCTSNRAPGLAPRCAGIR